MVALHAEVDETKPIALGHLDEGVPDLPEQRLAPQAPDPREDPEDDMKRMSRVHCGTAMVSDAIPTRPATARPRAASATRGESELGCHARSVRVGSDTPVTA